MKVTNDGRIQMDIGEKVNYAGNTYTVVRDDKNSLCGGCPFTDFIKCPIFACSPLSRDDGKSVVFEEVKNARRSKSKTTG